MAKEATQFKKGHSGNPGGRPKKLLDLQALARVHTTDAIQTLITVMSAKKSPAAARINAACALLDRGYGRPIQMTQVTGANGGPIQTEDITDLEVARRVAFLLAQGTEAMERQHLDS